MTVFEASTILVRHYLILVATMLVQLKTGICYE
jgi:hypothetical protein